MDIAVKNMEEEHLQQVLAIESVSFPTPWSESSYLGELKENTLAQYYVCLDRDGVKNQVLGYVGMWLILDEAHITTIAVNPDVRSCGVGQYMMTKIFTKAIAKGVKKITLEVRPSNKAALSLYKKMGFKAKGIRAGYYSDNGEDAIIMWKDLIK